MTAYIKENQITIRDYFKKPVLLVEAMVTQ